MIKNIEYQKLKENLFEVSKEYIINYLKKKIGISTVKSKRKEPFEE